MPMLPIWRIGPSPRARGLVQLDKPLSRLPGAWDNYRRPGGSHSSGTRRKHKTKHLDQRESTFALGYCVFLRTGHFHALRVSFLAWERMSGLQG